MPSWGSGHGIGEFSKEDKWPWLEVWTLNLTENSSERKETNLNETFKWRDTELTLIKKCICFPYDTVICSLKAWSITETKNGPVFTHVSVVDIKPNPTLFNRLTDFHFLILEPHPSADLMSAGLPQS